MAREFQTRMTTLSAKWQLFKNRLFNVNSSVGASLKDSMTSLMDGVGNLLDKIETWIDEHPKLTSTIAKQQLQSGKFKSIRCIKPCFKFYTLPSRTAIFRLIQIKRNYS